MSDRMNLPAATRRKLAAIHARRGQGPITVSQLGLEPGEWHCARDGETSSDFCDRMGWRVGQRVQGLHGILDGQPELQCYTILALRDPEGPALSSPQCDVRLAWEDLPGSTRHVMTLDCWCLTGYDHWPWRALPAAA